MAFCTNCGSTMDATSHFCTKCGKSVTPAGTAPAATSAAPAAVPPIQAYTPQPPSSGGSNIGKILLIVGGVLVVIFILSIGSMVFVAHRIKSRVERARMMHDGNSNSVDFGGFKASTNKSTARDLARKIGVDMYPGASQSGDSSEAQFGNMTTASIKLTTGDSVQKVADFYKSRYSSAMSSLDGNKFSLVSDDKGGTLTVNAEDMGGETKIEIVKVSGLKIEVK
ncbi:hypothetical protein Acid345_2992 [Candidatus Koribacter versatilis Ellin345]|uniref:Zinc-ribbon domain-containing protein n=1 Tax=Koribacter versatilis (strain Ellin345) TaxID=204669 RepID=Q1IMA7_KORVE|nr:zinc ribbon domain-containing protein [Candidatus Koribacter versatilis]ABF41993.1 hypothetical protein Acid345_2992 [Candidatus Koribacter versatilis Ellin345]